MKKVLAFLIFALLLVNCDKDSVPPAKSSASGDPLQRKLQEIAGSGATDCGRLKSQAPDQLEPAGNCAMAASKKKQAFYVAYEMPGLTVALAGDSTGKLFSVQQEQAAGAPSGTASSGNASEVVATPCTSELRIAQSGRVTCIPPGSMGGSMMGGAGPHGGQSMPPASGASPHGGMSMPPASGASPHGGMSMPPASGASPHGGGSSNLPSSHSNSAP